MESLSIIKTRSSLYCWIILAIFIIITMIFMINFYNNTLKEISRNSIVINNNNILQELNSE